MTVYREGGGSVRVSKTRDRVYTDEVDGATAWLPATAGATLTLAVSKGYPSVAAPTTATPARLITSPDFPNAVVVLERKLGGQRDAEAQIVEQVNQSNAFLNMPVKQSGYHRLRVRAIDLTSDPMGVVLELTVTPVRSAN